jgi:hypothetical protein
MNSSFLFPRLPLLLFSGWLISSGVVYAEESKPAINSPSAIAFESLEQMDELVELGMPALALRLLKLEQQHWPIYSPDWYAFEQKHIILLFAIDNWQAIVDRTVSLLLKAQPGKQITVEISQWFMSQQIIARLKLHQPEKALWLLRAMLWNAEKPVTDSDLIALWRRLIIRAYLLMNADGDAQKALLRYQQDYRGNYLNLNKEWRLLQARVLLRLKRPEEVISLLSEPEFHIVKALRLVASVRAYPNTVSLYVKDAEKQLAGKKLSREEVWAYTYVLYEAVRRSNDLIKTSFALKNLLKLGRPRSAMGEEFFVGSDELWKLYESIGNQAGNRSRLLIGDDAAWYDKAGELQKKKPEEALGLYTVLAFNAGNAKKRQLAHKEIVNMLVNDADGLELVNQLYLNGTRISRANSLPAEVRYRLVDYALSKSDITLAARLMQDLVQAPDGQDVFDWKMRKSRVLMLEGRYEAGESTLTQAIKEQKQLTSDQMDHYLQVVFDVQTVKRHKQALKLFDLLKDEWLTDKVRLELLFWKAESYFVLNEFERSAWMYLKSALLAEKIQYDLWAQSARYKAAGALTKAALYDDAQKIYSELMSFAATESKKAVIKQELQQLRLLRNAEKSRQSK